MARVTVHLNGKRRGTTYGLTPMPSPFNTRSPLVAQAIAQARQLQHVKAGGVIDMAAVSFDTHWGSMVRCYHPEEDTPDAHEARNHPTPNGVVETAELRVTTDKHVSHMINAYEQEKAGLAIKREYLRTLSARRNDVASLRLDND